MVQKRRDHASLRQRPCGLLHACKDARPDTREHGRAKHRHLGWAHGEREAERIGLDLKQGLVVRQAAVDAQGVTGASTAIASTISATRQAIASRAARAI